MTREKLENLLYRFQVDSFNNEVSQFEYEDIAREILKSFESRTCENCIMFEVGHCSYLDIDIWADFGCNRFYKKD